MRARYRSSSATGTRSISTIRGILPLITFGVAGVNLFESFDCAYCLTGFYINEATVAAAVHDLDATEDRFPIRIRTQGHPPRRIARVDLPDDRETILPHIAQGVLDQKEGDVVVQAVGRVRPFTKRGRSSRSSTGPCPGRCYTREFRSICRPAVTSASRPEPVRGRVEGEPGAPPEDPGSAQQPDRGRTRRKSLHCQALPAIQLGATNPILILD